jgi:outer membrane biosynthesis protein TonB
MQFTLKKSKPKAKPKTEASTVATLKSEPETTRHTQPKKRKLGSVQQLLPETFSKATSISKTTKEKNDTTSDIKKSENKIEKNESEEFVSGILNDISITSLYSSFL